MPAKNTRAVVLYLTPDQIAVLDQLADADRSAYIRALVAQDAEQRGLEWPEHYGRGEYPRQAESEGA